MERYDPAAIEPRWRRWWEERGLHHPDLSDTARKCYALVMFSYPSGDRLHIGHWYSYVPADAWARMRLMQGWNVFEPVGFDAFGFPAENFAIKHNAHPADFTEKNMAYMRTQLQAMGAMYDWEREVVTCRPDYYKWTQWLFLRLFHAGLAYRKQAPVNWCPRDESVLANEQVLPNGTCERCGATVTKRDLTQWFFKITAYADRLLEGLDRIDWPEKTKALQRNWIGRSEGAEIRFAVEGGPETEIEAFTTRPDTLYGATYLVLAPEHPIVDEIVTSERRPAVEAYREAARRVTEIERTSTVRAKSGEFTGTYAVHPLSGERLPIWVADYVLLSYGTGAIMAVPAHDQRDQEFASAFGLPVRRVVVPLAGDGGAGGDGEATIEPGVLVDSGPFSGLSSEEGARAVVAELERVGRGRAAVKTRLRDWLVSRQRYWGAPIPIVHCPRCGLVPVPEDQLPVLLPYDVQFGLGEGGLSPLARSPTFRRTTCPSCGGPAERDLDTMDTFVDSSWYFLRYLSPHDESRPWDPALVNAWCPVDMYVGGIDHATMHLLYARFVIQALHDLGEVGFDEPFQALRHQGQITRGGAKMSKRWGNVVAPEEYIPSHGTDALRLYLLFGFTFEQGGDWEDSGLQGASRFLQRVWRMVLGNLALWPPRQAGEGSDGREGASPAALQLERARHHAIHHATQDLERFRFNTAISRVMELVNAIYARVGEGGGAERLPAEDRRLLRLAIEDAVRLVAPAAPHVAEELWHRMGHERSVFESGWPGHDPTVLAAEDVTVVIQMEGKKRDEMRLPRDLPDDEVRRRALAHGRIPSLLDGREVAQVVVVPNRLVNIVTRGRG